jgi:hypothetical protein
MFVYDETSYRSHKLLQSFIWNILRRGKYLTKYIKMFLQTLRILICVSNSAFYLQYVRYEITNGKNVYIPVYLIGVPFEVLFHKMRSSAWDSMNFGLSSYDEWIASRCYALEGRELWMSGTAPIIAYPIFQFPSRQYKRLPVFCELGTLIERIHGSL